MSWLVSCTLIRMQISCIVKHLGAFLRPTYFLLLSSLRSPSFSSLPLPYQIHFLSSFHIFSLLSLLSFLPVPLFFLLLPSLCLRSFASSAVVLLSPAFSVCQSELSFIPSFHFILIAMRRFTWSLSAWFCRPEEDLTRGCIFRLVWILLSPSATTHKEGWVGVPAPVFVKTASCTSLCWQLMSQCDYQQAT